MNESRTILWSVSMICVTALGAVFIAYNSPTAADGACLKIAREISNATS